MLLTNASKAGPRVFQGLAVAERTGSATLLRSVRESFVHGMDLALMVSAAIAILGMVLALVFLPRHREAPTTEIQRTGREGEAVVAG